MGPMSRLMDSPISKLFSFKFFSRDKELKFCSGVALKQRSKMMRNKGGERGGEGGTKEGEGKGGGGFKGGDGREGREELERKEGTGKGLGGEEEGR